MSVDFEIVCDTCKLRMHAGQFMGGGSSFGYGSTDAEGRQAVSSFAFEHAYHSLEGVRIVVSDTTEKKRSDKYKNLDEEADLAGVDVGTIVERYRESHERADERAELLRAGVEHAEALGHAVTSFLAAPASDMVERFAKTNKVPKEWGRRARDFVRHYFRKNNCLPTHAIVEQGISLTADQLRELIEVGQLVELPLYPDGPKVQVSCPASTAHENDEISPEIRAAEEADGFARYADRIVRSYEIKSLANGSGDFSIGSKVWPGTSKVIEEMGELMQVLGKLIAVAGNTKHWDGDLRPKLIEEMGDLTAALMFFTTENLTDSEQRQIVERTKKKRDLFRQWHADPRKP